MIFVAAVLVAAVVVVMVVGTLSVVAVVVLRLPFVVGTLQKHRKH